MGQEQLSGSEASDLIWVCRRLAAALQGNHSVVAALNSIAKDAPPRARQLVDAMRQALAGGRRMGQAVTELGLPSFAGGLVWNGESGGPDRLIASLGRLADQLEFERQLGEPRDLLLFAYGLALSRLATMLQVRVPVLEALDAAADSVTLPQVAQALHEARVAVAEGLPVSTALPMATDDLPANVIEMVEEGEAAGRLGEVLAIAADYLFDEAGRKEA